MADKLFRLEVIAPDRTFYEGDVSMVELRTTEGEIGIYAEHVPTTLIVAPGVLKITETEGQKEAALLAGFIEILKDKVTVLAESVEWPNEIDINRANESKIRAERRLKDSDSSMNLVRAEIALKRALVRIEVGSSGKR